MAHALKAARRTRKKERLEARVTPEQKRLIARAAALRGTSVTDFVVVSAQQAAKDTIMDFEISSLRDEAREVFVNAILNPPAPNAAARAAALRYKEQMRLWLEQEENKSHLFIEPLGKAHDRATFSCGVEPLDRYLHKQAMQDVKKRTAVVFVLTPDGETIAGFYALSQYAVELDVIPEEIAKQLPKYPLVPATLLGRLAVSAVFRGRGLGERLLMDALYRCLGGSKQLGSAAVVVDAKDDKAVSFYKKYGFLELPKVAKRLFLPMGTVEKLFE